MQIQAYEEIFREYHGSVYRLALRITQDDELAKDIAQEVHIKCWRKKDILESVSNPGAWILRVTRNLSIDKIRARKRLSNLDDTVVETPSADITPERAAEVSNMMTVLKELIATLPEKQRAMFQLREIEGLQYKEISEVMGVSLDEIKVGLFRARKKIRERITKVDNYGLSA